MSPKLILRSDIDQYFKNVLMKKSTCFITQKLEFSDMLYILYCLLIITVILTNNLQDLMSTRVDTCYSYYVILQKYFKTHLTFANTLNYTSKALRNMESVVEQLHEDNV